MQSNTTERMDWLHLRAAYRPDYNCILFEVIDFGYGISEIDQKKIFERFYRVSNPKTRNISGTGLGLSIVKRLVDRMGARIEVRSKINQGTVFRIFLQKVPEQVRFKCDVRNDMIE